MAKKASSSAGKLIKYLKAPIRALGKARDFYVRSLTNCAGNMGPGLYPNTLPKSFSVASSRVSNDDEDMREVMRMVTQKSLREKLEAAAGSRGRIPAAGPKDGLPKSFSVAIGRIDEDKPYYGEGDVKVELYPRSRSHAVSMKRSGMFIS